MPCNPRTHVAHFLSLFIPGLRSTRFDIYVVNEDGDRPIKRDFCNEHGLEYVVLKRLPKPGLPRREGTHLRGF